MKEANLQDILYTISTWKVEANSDHNDGFTRQHYLTKIFKVEEALNRIKKPKVVT